MWEYVLFSLSFLTAATGVLGKTHDDSYSGIKGIKPLGWAVFAFGIAVLVVSCMKASQTASQEKQKDGKIDALNGDLALVRQEQTTTSATLKTTEKELQQALTDLSQIGTLQTKFDGVQQRLNASVSEESNLMAQRRGEEQAINARSMRVAIDNSFCSLNIGFQAYNVKHFSLSEYLQNGIGGRSMQEMKAPRFQDYINHQDIGEPMPSIILPKFAHEPIYKAMDFIAKRALDDIASQLQSSATYLPLPLIERIKAFKLHLEDGLDIEEHERREVSIRDHPERALPPIFPMSHLTDFPKLLNEAELIDQSLSRLSGEKNPTSFPFYSCRDPL